MTTITDEMPDLDFVTTDQVPCNQQCCSNEAVWHPIMAPLQIPCCDRYLKQYWCIPCTDDIKEAIFISDLARCLHHQHPDNYYRIVGWEPA